MMEHNLRSGNIYHLSEKIIIINVIYKLLVWHQSSKWMFFVQKLSLKLIRLKPSSDYAQGHCWLWTHLYRWPVTFSWLYMYYKAQQASLLPSPKPTNPNLVLATEGYTRGHNVWGGGCKTWSPKDCTTYLDNKYWCMRLEPFNTDEEDAPEMSVVL